MSLPAPLSRGFSRARAGHWQVKLSASSRLPPAITTWLDRMAQRGTTDRRAQSLHITPEGERLVSQALTLLLEPERALLAGLSDGERQILLEMLHKVACARPR